MVRMVGNGVDMVWKAPDLYGGLPTYVTAPRSLRKSIEETFRSVLRDEAGGVGQFESFGGQHVRLLAPEVFRTAQAVEFSLYKKGSDGVARIDPATRRVFRLYTTHDYSGK